jgi:hypothetical protein
MGDERLPPFANEAHDVDLANATFRVSNADLALNRLYRKHGDDADSRGDYQRVDAACDEELDILANTPSRTSRGIIAKAEALYESRLIEDYERHGSIANSLAADILRYFGV